jgi:hypothetical protein
MANGLFNLKQVVQAVQQGGWPAQKTPAVEYLVVAGGGGGARQTGACGAGGGAGGLLMGIDPVPNGQTLLVTVGAGGAGQVGNGAGTSGANSVFGAISSTGGGGGGSYDNIVGTGVGLNGGSGGGGSGQGTTSGWPPGNGIVGQGNAGGGLVGTDGTAAGGGGGASTAGLKPVNSGSMAGNGGAGIASAISGTVTTYAGGGGGGGYYANGGTGGVGGGGNGGYSGTAATSGTLYTGGGGGGNSQNGASGSGGDGIVIVSYPDVYAAATTVNATASTSGSGSFYNAGVGALGYSGTTPFDFGTGNFTIEGWYNLANFNNASGGGNPGLIGYGTPNWLLVIPGGAYNFYIGGSVVASSSAVASANVWNHFAVVRSGTVLSIYHNGTSVAAVTNTSSVSIGSNGLTVGANGTSGVGSITGYMSNVRVVKGVAVYTGAFTPPTAPLQATQPAGTNIAAITGTATSLLVSTVSGAYTADSSTNSAAANTNTTGISWNQLSPFTGTGYKNRVYTWTTSGTITF